MGCGESKIKKINLTPDSSHLNDSLETVSGRLSGGTKSSAAMSPDYSPEETLPNRLLAAIPVSDLGDSLDSRHLGESINYSHFSSGKSRPGTAGRLGGSAESGDSTDSGFDEYDEENSHIITENSAKEAVRLVEEQFRPVELPELLVITGRACARILSGYQKSKLEERKILDSLREEGLLAKHKGKTAGGLSFEVVDSAVVEEQRAKSAAPSGRGRMDADDGGDVFVSSKFIPQKKLERLEHRRTVRQDD